MSSPLAIGLLLCSPVVLVAPADAPAPISALVLRADGLDRDALAEAVQLRAPQRTQAATARQAAGVGARFAFVDLRAEPSGAVSLSIVLSDGNAYFRTVAAPSAGQSPEQIAADRIRVAASTLSNLLAAIEEERVEPDAVDVPLPEEVLPGPDPVVPPTPVDTPVVPPPAAIPRPPLSNHALWIAGAPSVVLAVGPPAPAGLAAVGGQLDLDLRHRRGALGSIALRGAARSVGGFVAGRIRMSAGGGLGKQWGDLDLVAALLLDAEPLWVREAGTRASITTPDGRVRDTLWMLGGHARVGLSWVPKVASLSGDRWVRLRVGPRVELGGSGLVAGGVARLRTLDEAGARVDLVRAGGLELAVLLDLGIGVQLRPR